jgi:hypothetical protein
LKNNTFDQEIENETKNQNEIIVCLKRKRSEEPIDEICKSLLKISY